MRAYWPKDENVMSWDPENMDKYWAMCQQYDRYPGLDAREVDRESSRGFSRVVKKNKQAK